MQYLKLNEDNANCIVNIIRLDSIPDDDYLSINYYELTDYKLDTINEIIKGYGVEALSSEYAHIDNYYFNIFALYINMGDPYIPTIVYDTKKDCFLISSWGDFYETTSYYQKEMR